MIIRTKYRQIEFIGLYYLLNKDLFITPYSSKLSLESKIHLDLSAYQSEMIGLYYILTDDFFIYPSSISQEEKNKISSLTEYGIELIELKTRKNALANNIVIDNTILVNPNLEKYVKDQLRDIIGKEVVDYELLGYKTIGSVIVSNIHGFLVHYKTPPEKLEELEELLKKPGTPTTANMGVPFLNISVVPSSDIILIGKKTTGIEEMKIRQVLLPQ